MTHAECLAYAARRGAPFIGKSREPPEPAGCLLWARDPASTKEGGDRKGRLEFNERQVAEADTQACTLDAAAGGCVCTRAGVRGPDMRITEHPAAPAGYDSRSGRPREVGRT